MMRRALAVAGLLVLVLGGCSTGSPRPKPSELQPITPTIAVHHLNILTRKVPSPAMISAMQPLCAAATIGQTATTMRAHIVIGADCIGVGADDSDGIIQNVIGIEIANFRNFLLTARHLPSPWP